MPEVHTAGGPRVPVGAWAPTLTWERWGWTHRRCPRRAPCCGSLCQHCRARGAVRQWSARWSHPPSATHPGRTGWTQSWTQTACEEETHGRHGDWSQCPHRPPCCVPTVWDLYTFNPPERYQPTRLGGFLRPTHQWSPPITARAEVTSFWVRI